MIKVRKALHCALVLVIAILTILGFLYIGSNLPNEIKIIVTQLFSAITGGVLSFILFYKEYYEN
jgi:hypothetical protein